MRDVVVETAAGPVRGVEQDGVVRFLGIPYAAPPVGRLRFRAARPHGGWREPADCTGFSAIAPQPPPGPTDALPGDPTDTSEDCLTLNIWCEAGALEGGGGRPVMVYVHGGGFATGSGGVALYRGDALTRRGVVVVTFNYRLGALGWLAHPELADEDGGLGNWGLSDQLAALDFVRQHIERFGGDPGNVTVFGESAGAMSVAALLGARGARGLFGRAVMQSGAAVALGVDSAAELTEAVATELGLDRVSRAGLEAAPVAELVEAQRRVSAIYEGMGLPFQPVVDGGLLLEHPAVSIAAGSATGVDLLIGTNRDEWAFFTFTTAALAGIDRERLMRLARRHVRFAGLDERVDAEAFVAVIEGARRERGQSLVPADVYTAFGTDWVFRVPSMRLAESHAAAEGNHRVSAYLFDWETPFGDGMLGSCHALELPFVFGTVANPVVAAFSGGGPDGLQLSERMQAAWVAFAWSGDPSCDEVGSWPAYEAGRRSTMRLGRLVEVLDAPGEPERAFLSSALGPYGEAETVALEHRRDARAARSLDHAAPAGT